MPPARRTDTCCMEESQRMPFAGQVVVFSLADEEYALPVGRVQEIVRHVPPRSIGAAVPWVEGIISLRGRILPVVDLGVRFGVAGTPGNAGASLDEAKIVVVESESGVAGIVVAGVSEVLTLAPEHCEPLAGADDDCRYGIAKLGDRLIALIDTDRLLAGLGGISRLAAAAA
jgi:purine-binding chemotaxis protein CheW